MHVLGYHGVVDHGAPQDHFAALFTDVRDFESQMELVARQYAPVGIDEIEAAISGGSPLPHRAVHVTFDDGYRNNLAAAEILDRLRIPWSLFVVVDTVLEGYRPWFLRLAAAIEATSSVMLPDGSVLDVSRSDRKWAVSRRLKCEIMAAHDQDAVVDQILSWKGVRRSEETVAMLSLSELKQLNGSGTAIGNHSASHRNLLQCSDEELAVEISDARGRLERALGSPVEHFAYPDGRSNRRVRMAVGANHRLGLATWTPRRALDRLAIRRYEPMNDADLTHILGGAEPAIRPSMASVERTVATAGSGAPSCLVTSYARDDGDLAVPGPDRAVCRQQDTGTRRARCDLHRYPGRAGGFRGFVARTVARPRGIGRRAVRPRWAGRPRPLRARWGGTQTPSLPATDPGS